MTITICKCDICGKEIHTPDGCVELSEWEQNGHFCSKMYELCDECTNNIIPNISSIIDLAKKGIKVK